MGQVQKVTRREAPGAQQGANLGKQGPPYKLQGPEKQKNQTSEATSNIRTSCTDNGSWPWRRPIGGDRHPEGHTWRADEDAAGILPGTFPTPAPPHTHLQSPPASSPSWSTPVPPLPLPHPQGYLHPFLS